MRRHHYLVKFPMDVWDKLVELRDKGNGSVNRMIEDAVKDYIDRKMLVEKGMDKRVYDMLSDLARSSGVSVNEYLLGLVKGKFVEMLSRL